MAFGYCSHERHYNKEIDRSTFEWKGCWNCYHFNPGDEYDLLDIKQMAEILNVSCSKVRSLIRKGELEADLFERGRDMTFYGGLILGARKKYFIRKMLLNNFIEKETP
jgi:excisionase family DNA binding protein